MDIHVGDYCMLLIKLQVQVLGIFVNYYFQKISILRLVYVSAVYTNILDLTFVGYSRCTYLQT